MKRKIFFIAIIMIFVIAIFAQNVSAKVWEFNWELEYDKYNEQIFNDIIATPDGGFVVVGNARTNTFSQNSYSSTQDAIIVKYDSEHNIEWEKVYGGEGSDQFLSVTVTSDGNYVVVGNSDSQDLSVNDKDIRVVKYDTNGNILLDQIISFNYGDYPDDIIETSNGDFIIVGELNTTGVSTGSAYDGFMIVLDNEFELKFTKMSERQGYDNFKRIVETKDNEFIVIGNTQNLQSVVAKMNKDFGVEWEIVTNELYTVIPTSDGNILTAGLKQDTDYNIVGVVTKRNVDGEIIWEKEVKNSEGKYTYLHSAIETSTNEYIIVGEESDSSTWEDNGLIMKCDEQGNIVWKESYVKENDMPSFWGVEQLKNKEIIAMGRSNMSYYGMGGNSLLVGYKEFLKTIEVSNVIEPLAGETPVYEGIKIPEEADYEIDTIAWHVSDTEDGDYESMEKDEKFEAGKYYRLQLEFVTKNNYEFLSPIKATINGKEAVAMTTYTEAQAFAILEFGKLAEAKEYNVIEGANQTYTVGESNSAIFKIDAEYSKLLNVKIDGKEITDFTAESGSTIITISKSYVESLALVEHTLVATFIDGRATTKFTVKEKETTQPTDPTIPDGSVAGDITGDNTGSTPGEGTSGDNTETDKPNVDDSDKDNTEKENITTDNKDTNKPTGNNPQTSDNIITFVIILGIAVMGIVITTKIRKHIKE